MTHDEVYEGRVARDKKNYGRVEMKARQHKETKVLGYWVNFGYSFRRIGFGFSLDKYALNVDFLFFWFGIEF